MNLKKIGKVFTSKFVGTGPSSYKKKNLPGRGLPEVEKHCFRILCPRFSLLIPVIYTTSVFIISTRYLV